MRRCDRCVDRVTLQLAQLPSRRGRSSPRRALCGGRNIPSATGVSQGLLVDELHGHSLRATATRRGTTLPAPSTTFEPIIQRRSGTQYYRRVIRRPAFELPPVRSKRPMRSSMSGRDRPENLLYHRAGEIRPSPQHVSVAPLPPPVAAYRLQIPIWDHYVTAAVGKGLTIIRPTRDSRRAAPEEPSNASHAA